MAGPSKPHSKPRATAPKKPTPSKTRSKPRVTAPKKSTNRVTKPASKKSKATREAPLTVHEILETAHLFGKFLEFWTPASAGTVAEEPGETPSMSRVFRKPEKSYINDGALISEPGYTRLCEIYNGIDSRIPELNGVGYIYNDYAGYGMIEVLEMQVVAYDKEMKKKRRRDSGVTKLYPIAEALAFVFAGHQDDLYLMVDDGQRVEELVRVMGSMFLHCIRTLEKENYGEDEQLLRQDGLIKNIGLTIGNMCGLADSWTAMVGWEPATAGWKKELLRIAAERGIKVMRIEGGVKEYSADYKDEEDEDEDKDEDEDEDEGEDEDEDEDEEDEDPTSTWDFPQLWKDYKKSYGASTVGQSMYDLSKLTKAEKKRLERSDSFSDF